MHLPDGFLDAKTALLSTAAAAAGLGVALRQVRTSLDPRQTPMLGLAAAFVFAAQMLNFPVAGGTSGHLMGGVLTAILLGPSAAVLVLSCVLIVQCLMFADGGLMALGANIFNMALVNVAGGYFAFRGCLRLLRRRDHRATVCAAAFAGWFGTVLSSICCAGELALSRTAPWSIAFPAMANVHMLIGLGEGLVTGLVTLAVLRARPELVAATSTKPTTTFPALISYGLLLAAGLAVFVAPFACPWPDGLERVARKIGFEIQAAPSALSSPLAEYRVPWLGSAATATAVAGLIGTVVAFAAAWLLARVVVPVLGAPKKHANPGS